MRRLRGAVRLRLDRAGGNGTRPQASIDQSSCNKDFSCLKGFCPSFVTLEGAKPRKAEGLALDLPKLPDPGFADPGAYNIRDNRCRRNGCRDHRCSLGDGSPSRRQGRRHDGDGGPCAKGGAVHIHCRIAEQPSDLSAIRVAVGEADAVIGGDLVVTAGAKTIGA